MFDKKEVIKKYKIHTTDNGSTDVQVAVLTHRINYLVEHLKKHKKDHHSRKGLLVLVGRRKRHLSYLKGKDTQRFLDVTKKLKIKVKAAA